MRVDSVKENNKSNSMIPSIIKSMAIFGVAGYAAKYSLPLTKQERDEFYWKRIATKRNESKNEKAAVIAEIRKLPNKSEAQDVFIKMIDARKANPELSSARKMFLDASMLKGVSHAELKNIIAKVNEHATRMTQQHIDFYNKGLKGIRQTAPFVAFGLVVGFVAGVAYNVIKAPCNDYNV